MTTPRAPSEFAAVYAFGRYETLFRVGTGGMAEVFAARLLGEAGFERLVAIKRLLPHLAEDPQHVARFLDEARLAARILHPHVVQTLDLGRTDEGEPFLVLELVVGNSLDQLLTPAHRPPLPVLLSWLAQAAEGLHAAHVARSPDGAALGLVHRDVSPHNILVGLDGNARIGDFGVAQAALLKSSRTPHGSMHGKFAYFSPEQALGRTLDARSDVFSLGIVAWEAVTGRPLFQADQPVMVIDRVRGLPIPAPHKLVRGLPAGLSEVIMAALERDPAQRTASAQLFARQLAGVSHTLGLVPSAAQRAAHVRASQHPVWQRLGQASLVATLPPVTSGARRWRAWALLPLACALGAWLWLRAPAARPRTRPPAAITPAVVTTPLPIFAPPDASVAPSTPAPRAKRRVHTAPARVTAPVVEEAPQEKPSGGTWGGRS